MKIFLSACMIAFLNLSFGLDISWIQKLEQIGRYEEVFNLCKKTQDESLSLYFMADYLYHGRKGIEQNQVQGKIFYQKVIPSLIILSESGDITAQYYLGRCYEYGQNDSKLARQWYIKAADNGNAQAMCKAAMFIAKRRGGGEKDAPMVMNYIQKAIAAGNPDGKALLASYYLEGRKDVEKGVTLAKEATELKSPLGQMILGEIYFRGLGSVKRDANKALQLFQSASDQGNSMVNDRLREMKEKKQPDNENSGAATEKLK